MKTETEKSTVLFCLALVFCILSTIAIYLTLKPTAIETESSNIIIFSHPENAS
jgi:CHASE3 domain sensor protein